MNRLVIIGNGFDLAHGLETTYNDFFTWLWKKYTDQSQISIFFNGHQTECNIKNDLFSYNFSINKLINKQQTIKEHYIPKITPWKETFNYIVDESIQIRYTTSNIFLENLLSLKLNTNEWANIENLYFILLKKISKSENSSIRIKDFNKDFETIKNIFEHFLSSTINLEKAQALEKVDSAIFYRRNSQILTTAYSNTEIHVLNFNYTKTTELYNHKVAYKIKINHIHGELNSKDNPIIFGYGDERGAEYKELELLDNNDFFEHIKSFAYLNTPNYSQLITFLNTENFDVVIIGHSCALTDRTLLNTIFEHPHCKAIKPIYYKNSKGKDNYQDIVRNISRSFDDKIKMRSLIVDKTQTEHL